MEALTKADTAWVEEAWVHELPQRWKKFVFPQTIDDLVAELFGCAPFEERQRRLKEQAVGESTDPRRAWGIPRLRCRRKQEGFIRTEFMTNLLRGWQTKEGRQAAIAQLQQRYRKLGPDLARIVALLLSCKSWGSLGLPGNKAFEQFLRKEQLYVALDTYAYEDIYTLCRKVHLTTSGRRRTEDYVRTLSDFRKGREEALETLRKIAQRGTVPAYGFLQYQSDEVTKELSNRYDTMSREQLQEQCYGRRLQGLPSAPTTSNLKKRLRESDEAFDKYFPRGQGYIGFLPKKQLRTASSNIGLLQDERRHEDFFTNLTEFCRYRAAMRGASALEAWCRNKRDEPEDYNLPTLLPTNQAPI